MSAVTPLIQNRFLSHGTVECTDMAATRRFLTEFLGLDLIRPLPEAQYMWKGGPWSVVCVHIKDGDTKDQGQLNHFKLAVGEASEVDAAHAAALAQKDTYRIVQVTDLVERDGIRSFMLQDLDKTWWEISNVSQAHFDTMFAQGDKVH